MANTLLTPSLITKELLMRFKNNLGFAAAVRREQRDWWMEGGAKKGDSIKIRKPVRFTTNTGATYSAQDVTEESVTLQLTTQRHVDFEFSSKDLTLTIERFGERYLESAAVALANAFEVDGMTLAYQATANTVGTPGTVPNTLLTYLQSGEKIDNNGAPQDGLRSLVVNPKMQVTIVDALKGLFQSSTQVSEQYRKGKMGTAAGFDWIMAQNVRTHTVGPLGGTPLVNGASQTGANLITDGWTAAAAARLKKGDIFTVANVFAVNPVSGDTLADLQQFVVTADVSSDGTGNATIPIYPSIVTSGPRKTVSGSPADNAALTVLGAASTLTPQGLAFHKEAFCFGMAKLEKPDGVWMADSQVDPETGIAIRIVSDYDIDNDLRKTRCDILYGWCAAQPEWACRIAS